VKGEKKALHEIDQELCLHCGSCREACKFGAIFVV
jgi:Fe-S-cluster-containing hydrogenase component 2